MAKQLSEIAPDNAAYYRENAAQRKEYLTIFLEHLQARLSWV
ncbi:metal ABC transporter substrate-binding protein [Halomonas neptunia]|uniref:Metal ABC transporter substrate-binding protein n=1 Tax=Vreelandella neptunia TaxID=115551 RepID=A0ABS9S944_9GAMM|nr:metal ABC transporter substrate-binding protein [Halomonas neptunia]